jgi:uncharacterized protein (DUF58 family)
MIRTTARGAGRQEEQAGPTASKAVLNRLQLLVSRRLDGLLQGDYLGLLPGPGSEAGESREYFPGDDVRRMDWPVTARTTVPHVRLTVADRELETWLAIDLSASMDFGTAGMLKRDLALAASAAIIHLTVRGGNRAGAVIGPGDGGVIHRPARGGRLAAQALLKSIAATRSRPGDAALGDLIDALNRPPRRRGLAVVVSDFLQPPRQWERQLRKVGRRHDVLAVEVADPREIELPDVGVLELMDPETGATHDIQTADSWLRESYFEATSRQRAEIGAAVRGAGAQLMRLRTDSDWLSDLVRFVAIQRHRRRRS